jgi:hypothetical protein
VKYLKTEMVKYLVSPLQIFILNKEQSLGLESHQAGMIRHLDPDFYCLFTKKWQIDAVPPESITKIHSNYIPLISDPKQIACLAPVQVPFLLPAQVSMLPSHLVEHLTAPEQIKELSELQALAIKQHQAHLIPHLNPECYRSFQEAWQIQRVPHQFVNTLTKEQRQHLSQDQRGVLQAGTALRRQGLQMISAFQKSTTLRKKE